MTTPRMRVYFTRQSRNAKTGPIPVSTSSAETCPASCPLKGAGCYAESGPLAILWRKVTEGRAGLSWAEFLEKVETLPRRILWRHNQAGDLPGAGDTIDREALAQLVRANGTRRGFTYTHKPPTRGNLAAIRAANNAGFTVNLSADNLAEADTLADTGAGPVVVVLPADTHKPVKTPGGRTVAICPATISPVTCLDCGLCAMSNRKAIIGFPAHGVRKNAASRIASGG